MFQVVDNITTYLPYLPSSATRPPSNPSFPNELYMLAKTPSSDSEIRANVYKSLMLNSLSFLSIQIFDLLLQPLVQDQQKWFHRNIGWFYHILWLLPVVGTSLYLNVRPRFHCSKPKKINGVNVFVWVI
jgi:hypothetical protein